MKTLVHIKKISTHVTAIYIIVMLLLPLCTFGQNADWKRGDDAFKVGYYNTALDYYKLALKKNATNVDLLYKAARAAQFCNDYEQAIYFYRRLLNTSGSSIYPEAALYLGSMFRYNNQSDSAIVYFEKYLAQSKTKKIQFKERAKQELSACKWVLQQNDTISEYQIIHTGKQINTKNSEAGAILIDSVILFSRTVPISMSKSQNAMFSDFILTQIYQSRFLKNGKLSKSSLNEWGLNDSDKHTGNLTYDATSKTIYFTRCDPSSVSDVLCKIYMSKYENKKWSKPKKVGSDVNLDGYTSTQPAIGHTDGKTILYYVSDRPGGSGNLDIWYAVIEEDRIGKSINLGIPVNTPGDEITPFYSDNTQELYFSSDWHYGFGGYDIFVSKGTRDHWQKPVNLGRPINTSANDLYFSMHLPDTSNGFLTSNRKGSFFIAENTCCNDIYQWVRMQDTTCPCLKKKSIKKDSIPIAITKSNQEKIRSLLPIILYFHNDEPNPRSTETTTLLTYKDTYETYRNQKDEYKYAHRLLADSVERKHIYEKLDAFFENQIEKSYRDLEFFLDVLYLDLEKGKQIKLLIKGYASPLHTGKYNYNLSKRRISSFINQLLYYKNGALIPYLLKNEKENAQLQIEELPLGSAKANKDVSSNNNDLRQSVYSVEAAKERKIEIIDYQYIDSLQKTEPSYLQSFIHPFFLGKIQQDTIVEKEITIPLQVASETEIQQVDATSPKITILTFSKSKAKTDVILKVQINTFKTQAKKSVTVPISIRFSNNMKNQMLFLEYDVIPK